MSKKKDYIPRVDAAFNDWQLNLLVLIVANAVSWAITAGDVTALSALQTIFGPLYAKFAVKGTRSKADVKAYKDSRKAFKAAIRKFVKQWLANNSLVADEQRVKLGIPVPDGSRTPRPKITDVPSVIVSNQKGSVERLQFRAQADSDRPSLHPEANGVEIHYAVDKTVTTIDDCDKVVIISKATVRIPMDPVKAGKMFTGYARWINSSDPGKSGPYTPPFNGRIAE